MKRPTCNLSSLSSSLFSWLSFAMNTSSALLSVFWRCISISAINASFSEIALTNAFCLLFPKKITNNTSYNYCVYGKHYDKKSYRSKCNGNTLSLSVQSQTLASHPISFSHFLHTNYFKYSHFTVSETLEGVYITSCEQPGLLTAVDFCYGKKFLGYFSSLSTLHEEVANYFQQEKSSFYISFLLPTSF